MWSNIDHSLVCGVIIDHSLVCGVVIDHSLVVSSGMIDMADSFPYMYISCIIDVSSGKTQ